MNVLCLSDYAVVKGGQDQAAIAGAIACSQHGHRVVFVAGSGHEFAPELARAGVETLTAGRPDLLASARSATGIIEGLWSKQAEGFIEQLLGRFDPHQTVVHVHSWTKALTASIFPACQKRGFRPVITLNDYFLVCPNGAFFDFKAGEVCRRKPLSASCMCTQCDRRGAHHKAWRVIRHGIQKFAGQLPHKLDHAIFVSEYSRRVLEPYLAPPCKRYVVRNPVTIERRARIPAEANKYYDFVGRLTLEKGCAHFAQAARLAGVDARFLGDGYLRDEVRQVLPTAEITGWLTVYEVDKHLDRARALVFPSIWHEASPLAVVEALAKGIPVVASDACAAAEMVEPGVTGLVFPGGDVQSLAAALRGLRDDSLVRQLSEGAYRRFWSNPPSSAQHAEDLTAVYSDVLASQKDSKFR